MYALINANINLILQHIQGHIQPNYHIGEYTWLHNNLANGAWPADYTGRYNRYWVLGRRPAVFYHHYFALLTADINNLPATFGEVLQHLYQHTQRVEPSASSKLVHMLTPHMPIYDRFISRFYMFMPPPAYVIPYDRIWILSRFYAFLQMEYAHVSQAGILAPAIAAFRHFFGVAAGLFTDEKIIDSLVWMLMILVQQQPNPIAVNGPVTIRLCPPCRDFNQRTWNVYWRFIRRRLIALGLPVGVITVRHHPNGMPIPDWFVEWCEQNGFEIVYDDVDEQILLDNPFPLVLPDWMEEL